MKIKRYLLVAFVLVMTLVGQLMAESLLRMEDGGLFVDAPGGVDIRLTCGQWGPHDEGSASVRLHQGPYLDYNGYEIRAFNNVVPGEQAGFYFLQQDREIILVLLDHTTQVRYYTGPAQRNPDNQVHALIEEVPGDENTYLVRFEHSPYGGDDNFTDTQFTVTATKAPERVSAEPEIVNMGINLSSNSYYSTQRMFVDVMKTSMPWVTNNSYTVPCGENAWDTGVIDQIPLDENGYPLSLPYDVAGTEAPQVVTTLLCRVAGNYPSGIYTVYYDGEGDLIVGFDAHVIHEEPGKIQVDVTPTDAGIIIKIMRSVAGNHIRNIRVVMPGFEDNYEQQLFNPLFLERFKDLNALRFMVPSETNSSPVSLWEERTTPSYYTQGDERGVALEYLIELANRIDKDAWFCVPHMADHVYVQNMARLIRDNLNPGLKVYIEYSNEVWNGLFSQASYARDMGCQLGLSGDCSEGGNEFWSGIYYYALRTAEVFNIFDEEFAGDDRLIKVISTQTANTYVTGQLLERFHDPVINPTGVTADALGITGYFGTSADLIALYGEVDTITVDEILDRTRDSITRTVQYITQSKEIADQYNLGIVGYEGGQHLVATGANVNNETLTQKLISANRHPEMKDIYDTMFDAWFNYGGDIFMVFSSVSLPSKWGSWGILEYLEQPVTEAPKYLSVSQYTQKNKIPVYVHTSTGNPHQGLGVYAYTDSGEYTGNHTITGEDGMAYFNPGIFEQGNYRFRVDYQGYEFWSQDLSPVMGDIVDVIIDHETAALDISTASGPAGGITVCAFVENGSESVLCKTTDAQGMVYFELPVGRDYTFVADILDNAYASDLITVSGGAANNISINAGGGVLLVNARKGDALPIEGRTIRLFSADGSYLGISKQTDESGSAAFDVPEGVYKLVLDYLGHEFLSEEISLATDTTIDLDIAHQDVCITVREVFHGASESVDGVSVKLCTTAGDESGLSALTDVYGKAYLSLPESPFVIKVSYLGQEFISGEFAWQDIILDIPLTEAEIGLKWVDGQPLQGGIVSVLSGNGDDLGIACTADAQGVVVFRLPEGDYIFSAQSFGSLFDSGVETLIHDVTNTITIETGTMFTLSVVACPERPVRGIECSLLNGQGDDLGIILNTGGNGNVIFNLPDGQYMFNAEYLGVSYTSGMISVPDTNGYIVSVPVAEFSPRLGVNLSGFGYTSRQLMFTDVMKGSMPWVTQNSSYVEGGSNPFNTGVIDQIPSDLNGYPLELPYEVSGTEAPQGVFTFMMFTLVDEYLAGQYTMFYDGVGAFEFTGDVTVVSQGPGRIGLQVGPHVYGIGLKIVSSEAGDHVRNIRMIMPGYEEDYAEVPFYSSFTDRLGAFNVLRLNDVARTHYNGGTTWGQRAGSTYYTQCTNVGVALEHLIETANRTHKDPWFSVPYGVDDEYVLNMAELIRDNLDSDRQVYLEYYEDGFSLRHAEIFNIFEQAFGGDQRLVEIVKSWSVNNAQSNMERVGDSAYNPYGITIDAIAVKAYFGKEISDEIIAGNEVDTITVDEILDRAEASIFGELLAEIKAYKDVADRYDVMLFACEAGQGLVANGNDDLFARFTEANRHPRMKDLYTYMLDVWFNNGGDLMTLYSYVQHSWSGRNWGILEYQDQPIEEAPKYQAILEYGLNDISVLVQTSSGYVLSGYTVYAFTESGSYTGMHTQTDENGIAVFSYDDLTDGTYIFRVDYLGSEFFSDPASIPGHAGTSINIEQSGVSVSVDTSAGPASGIMVYVFSESGAYLGVSSETDENGAVSFDLPVGMVFKFRADLMGSQYWSEVSTVSGEDVNDISVESGGGEFTVAVDNGSGAPMEGIRIYLFRPQGTYLGQYDTTDAQGMVSFNVPDGFYKVRADYLGSQYWSGEAQISEDKAISLSIPHMDVGIDVQGVFQGEAAPLGGIRVYLFTSSGSYLGRYKTTSEQGHVVFNLPEQAFKVRADYLGSQYFSEEFTWGNAEVNVPIAEAEVSVVGSGEGLAGVRVYAFSTTGSYLGLYDDTGSETKAVFRLPAGDYTFRADYQGAQYWSRVAVLIEDQVNPVGINTGGGIFTIVVDNGSGAPMEGIRIYLFRPQGTYLGQYDTTDAQGMVSFNVPDGFYKVRADYLGSQYWSGEAQISEDKAISLSIPHMDVGIDVQGVFQGEAAPLGGIRVYLFTSSGSYLGRYKTTSEQGHVVFNLPEQAFKVRADYLGSQYFSEEFTWGNAEVNVPIAEAEVSVVGSGEGLAGVRVYAFSTTGSYLGLYDDTGSETKAVFRLPAGDYTFRADYQGAQYWSRESTLTPDQEISLEISTGSG